MLVRQMHYVQEYEMFFTANSYQLMAIKQCN